MNLSYYTIVFYENQDFRKEKSRQPHISILPPAERERARATDLAAFLRRQGCRNCVFVGCDESGIARHAHKRGTIARNKPDGIRKVCHLKIISYLRENIGQKITLADVCEKFKYSQANPYSLYTVSLKALSSGTGSALGIVEPLSATLFGTFLFGEELTLWSAAGIVLILSSVVLLGKAAVNVGQS